MPEQQQSVLKNRWVRAALGLLAFAGVVVLAWLLRPVLVPLFFAFIAAYVLDPVVDYFEKQGVRRMMTTLALAIVGLAVIISIPYYLLTGVMRESQELVQIAQTRMKNFNPAAEDSLVNEWLHKLPLDEFVEAMGWEPKPGEKIQGVEVIPFEQPAPVIPEETGAPEATDVSEAAAPPIPEETPPVATQTETAHESGADDTTQTVESPYGSVA